MDELAGPPCWGLIGARQVGGKGRGRLADWTRARPDPTGWLAAMGVIVTSRSGIPVAGFLCI